LPVAYQIRPSNPLWNSPKLIRERARSSSAGSAPATQFQDPGNKIFSLSALSVLCRVARRITSCSAFLASSSCDALLDLERRSYSHVFLDLRWLCARTHRRSCGPPLSGLAIAVVPNQAHTGPVSRCANRRSMPRAGGRRPAPSRGLSCPSTTAMSAPASLTRGAKSERSCQSRQLPANHWFASGPSRRQNARQSSLTHLKDWLTSLESQR